MLASLLLCLVFSIPDVLISPSTFSITEGSTSSVTYTVSLSQQPVTFVWVTLKSPVDADGVTSTRVSFNPNLLTFNNANYNLPQTVTVTIPDDSVAKGTQTLTGAFQVVSPDADFNSLAVIPVTIILEDDDVAFVSVSATSIVSSVDTHNLTH